MKYFSNGVKGKSSNGRDSWISCLLHEETETMILLQIEFCGKLQVCFRVDIVEPNDEEIAHILIETLVFLFEEGNQGNKKFL